MSYSFFATVFWLPVCAIPAVGGVVALARAIILARGKFMAATITSGGVSMPYARKDIGREGIPLALLFLVIAAIHGVWVFVARR